MRESVLHIPSFEGQYKTGLIFAMIEGLKMGEGIKIICEKNTEDLEVLLKEANIPQLVWEIRKDALDRWELRIEKKIKA